MYLNGKIVPIALLLVGSFYATTCAAGSYIYIPDKSIYSKGSEDRTLDEARARRMIAEIKGIDISQVWFATGTESYYRNPNCVNGASIWLFTKPTLSSSGIWRGKKGYIAEKTKDNSEMSCGRLVVDSPDFLMNIPTASFRDPASMHPEEAWDGIVPGIFQVYNNISDDELNFMADVIAQVRECISKDSKCPFAIERGDVYMSKYDLVATIVTGQLAYIQEQPSGTPGKPCYSMIFDQPGPWAGALAMDICYRGDKQVTKVTLSNDVVE